VHEKEIKNLTTEVEENPKKMESWNIGMMGKEIDFLSP